ERGDVEVADIEVVSDDFIQDWVGRIALEDDKVATVDILHPEDPVVVDEGFGTNGKIGNRGAPRAGPPRELIGDPERAVGIHIDAAEIAFTAVAVVVAAPLDEHRGLHRSSWVGWFAPGDPDGHVIGRSVGPRLDITHGDVAVGVDIDAGVHEVGVVAGADVALVHQGGIVDVADAELVPAGVVLRGADTGLQASDNEVIGFRRLHDIRGSAGRDFRAVRVQGVVDRVEGIDGDVL